MAPLTKTTLNNGYLGSRNDEERSEMRYVVCELQNSVNHRIFERILRSRLRPRACLPQRRFDPSLPYLFGIMHQAIARCWGWIWLPQSLLWVG